MDLEQVSHKSTAQLLRTNGIDKETKMSIAVKPSPNEQFNFPFEPYDIQLELMKVAYNTYESSKFALLESPTGTGKSLSLICSALTWLRDHQSNRKKNLEAKKEELGARINKLKEEEEISGDWIKVQTKCRDLNREIEKVNSQLEEIVKVELRGEARRHAKLHDHSLDNYSALNDNRCDKVKQSAENIHEDNAGLINSSQESCQVIEEDDDIEKRIKDQGEQVKPKIYYASRTHSQLSQFINEIKRTKFADINLGPPIKVAPLASRANLCVNPEVTKLKEPSAINERCAEMQRETGADNKCPYIRAKQVNKLKEDILSSVQDIEDIVSRGRVMGSCPYYAARMAISESEMVVLPYNNLLHHETRKASSLDLKESLVIVDEAHNILETICSIHSAQITGRQLIGSHTILSRYYKKFHTRMSPRNAEIVKIIVECLTVLIKFLDDPKRHVKEYECHKAVDIDHDRSEELKIDPNNKVSAINVSKEKMSNIKTIQQSAKHEEFMIEVTKFIGASNIERFNVFKIIDYFNRSQLARKLLGSFRQDNTFDLDIDLLNLPETGIEEKSSCLKEAENETNSPAIKKRKTSHTKLTKSNLKQRDVAPKLNGTSLQFLRQSNLSINDRETAELTSYPVYTFVEFLRSLTNLAHDGKVLVDKVEGNIQLSTLKFVLLNPSSQFKQMKEEARSIVLAGGTMQPFKEFTDLLFSPLGVNRDRLTLFSCGHVIGADQLYVSTLTHGATGKPIELSFKTRSSPDTIDEIGRTIANLSSIVPGGMVCFLPSYDYEQVCFNRWTKIGVIAGIETKSKQVFREPRQTSHLKSVLDEYSRVIEKGKSSSRGALLLCVVGGKMSEGINFNDDLGRCVVMIGLPYANIKSSELQQKMAHYDATCKKEAGGQQLSAGQQYYENLCIKGINQSIGRAVRHRSDYAAIILLDQRYASKTSIRNGLPEWMRKSLFDHKNFDQMFGQVKSFYSRMRSNSWQFRATSSQPF